MTITADPTADPAALADLYVRDALDRGPAELAGILARGRGFAAGLREALLRQAPNGRRLDAVVDTRLDLVATFLDELVRAFGAGAFFETPEDAADREAYETAIGWDAGFAAVADEVLEAVA